MPNPTKDVPLFISRDEATRRLRCHRDYIEALADKGILSCRAGPNGRRYYRTSQVEAVAQREREAIRGLIDRDAAAAILGCHRHTLAGYIEAERLPVALTLRNKQWFRPGDVEALHQEIIIPPGHSPGVRREGGATDKQRRDINNMWVGHPQKPTVKMEVDDEMLAHTRWPVRQKGDFEPGELLTIQEKLQRWTSKPHHPPEIQRWLNGIVREV